MQRTQREHTDVKMQQLPLRGFFMFLGFPHFQTQVWPQPGFQLLRAEDSLPRLQPWLFQGLFSVAHELSFAVIKFYAF